MKKKFNKKLLFLLLLLIPLIAITIYITYAFYIGEVEGNEQVSTIAVQGGNILINYQGNSENIVASKIMPGWEATKTFTVSCSINYLDKSTVKIVWYDMILVVDENTYENNSIEYSLQISDADKTKEGIFTEEEYHGIPKGTSNITMASGYLLNETTTHTYNLKLRYIDSDEMDQTREVNARLNARVNVAGSKQTTLTIDFNGGESNGTFALSKGPTYKVAANSRVYIPASHLYYDNDLMAFLYFEKVSGDGSASGKVVNTTSESISIKAIYADYPFNADSWSVIADNVRNNNGSMYEVGHAKLVDIDIDGDGTAESYKVRLANKSTPSKCNTSGFSQSACGFVVEFVDIIEKIQMNPTDDNVGGWPATAMRTYLNGTFKSKLPNDLQNVIANTTVVSGHGSTSGEKNFTSTDKIYLFSSAEIWLDGFPIYNGSNSITADTATTTTRQLDYYAMNNVTKTSNYSFAIKKYLGKANKWWILGCLTNIYFLSADSSGRADFSTANSTSTGVSPAFRIK